MRGTVACVNAGGCDKLCAFITLAVAGVADLLDGAHNAPRPVDAHVKPLEIPRRPCSLSKTQQTHRSMATEGADDRLASAAMREEEGGKKRGGREEGREGEREGGSGKGQRGWTRGSKSLRRWRVGCGLRFRRSDLR